MEENGHVDGQLEGPWAAVVRAYCELMDQVIPHLSPAEQSLYHRLFRLSHVQHQAFTQCRYEELARQCGLSLSTVRRAVKGLRAKQLIKTVWESKRGTTFVVEVLSTLARRPAFLPRRRENSPALRPPRPRIYDAFTAEDRALFISCKQHLSPGQLHELTEQAVEWLTERAGGDPEAFADELLRDKVDELVFREAFGAERQELYKQHFGYLYAN
jgi:hypothetical protein